MTEPEDRGHHDSALVPLMVEFRQLWLADQPLSPERLDPAPPPPAAPPRRAGFRGGLLLLLATAASAYLAAGIAVRPHGTPHEPPTSAGVGSTPNPGPSATAAGADAGSSEPSSLIAPQGPAGPAALTGASAPGASTANLQRAAGYRVQLGAFNVGDYARDLVDRLRSRGYPAIVVDVSSGPPHRVWLDGVFDQDDAKRRIDRLRNDGFEAILIGP